MPVSAAVGHKTGGVGWRESTKTLIVPGLLMVEKCDLFLKYCGLSVTILKNCANGVGWSKPKGEVQNRLADLYYML